MLYMNGSQPFASMGGLCYKYDYRQLMIRGETFLARVRQSAVILSRHAYLPRVEVKGIGMGDDAEWLAQRGINTAAEPSCRYGVLKYERRWPFLS